ncbi:hypothetical protein K431DRAFT_96934 [Polychaeton citri CBS 116435]|uniref:RING-type domain-containing protein n=1 Tax=Polychaeton citri CBS 116435 TaxID=1314669 RepID=A0A9P4Q5U3_9PEZI|nr:hypothetical protein K431DRAFT_96934 [Polychaeton citri CBS 116435]
MPAIESNATDNALESPASLTPNDVASAATRVSQGTALESPASPPPSPTFHDTYCLICATIFEADTTRISCEVCSRSFCAECVELWRRARTDNYGLALNCPHCRTVIDVHGRRRVQPTGEAAIHRDPIYRRRNALVPPLSRHPEQARRDFSIWTRQLEEQRAHDGVVVNLDESFQQVERLRIEAANAANPAGFILDLANMSREAGTRVHGNFPQVATGLTRAPTLPLQQFPPPLHIPQISNSLSTHTSPSQTGLEGPRTANTAATHPNNAFYHPAFESGRSAHRVPPTRPPVAVLQPPPNAPREPAAMRAQRNQVNDNTAPLQHFPFFRRNRNVDNRPNRAQLQAMNDAAQIRIRDMQNLLDQYRRLNIDVNQYIRRFNDYEQMLNDRIIRLLNDNSEMRSTLRNQADTIKDLQTIIAWEPIRAAIRAELDR